MSYYGTATSEAEQEGTPHPAIVAFKQVTIGQLYIFLLKLMLASLLAGAPIVLILWLITYASTH
jgi:hypothetical protein